MSPQVIFWIVVIVAIIGTIITMFIMISVQRKRIKRLKHENSNLKRENERRKREILILTDYSNAIKEIHDQNDKIKIQIKEAKTHEEIDNVISNIINANNKRVQDN